MNTIKNNQKKRAKKEVFGGVSNPDSISLLSTDGTVGNGASEMVPVNGDTPSENAYIKDLQRNIRNVTKKLAAMQKVDAIIAENPNTSLDDLVTTRKINADQKAQALKKPALQSQLVQFEDQITSFKKLEEELKIQSAKETAQLLESHKLELESLRRSLELEAKSMRKKDTRDHLLTLSTFLRAAAARRQIEDDMSEESKAFEGMLLLLYGGDIAAVDAAEKLINGSGDGVLSTEGQVLNVSYARIKELAIELAPSNVEDASNMRTSEASTTSTGETAVADISTDPTIVHAGLTELGGVEAPPQIDQNSGVGPTGIDEGAANSAAITNWEISTTSADPMQDSWVSVPRPAEETAKDFTSAASNDTSNWGNSAATWGEGRTANGNPSSWADEAPELPSNDGFREVHHHRGGRGRGGSGAEGRGGGRGGRGRGGKAGEFRGKGRGGRGNARGRGGGEP